MSFVEKPVPTLFRKCDWCGRTERVPNGDEIETIRYRYMAESGDHGVPSDYEGQLHVCSTGVDNCISKMCQHVLHYCKRKVKTP